MPHSLVATRRHRRARWKRAASAALAAVVVAILGLLAASPASAAYGQIEGTGSTWSQVIVDQWIADVSANGMQVVYTGGGSSKGRKDFAQGSTDFAISEIPYQGAAEQDTSGGREFAYLPIVAGGTSFTYHLEAGGKLVRDIRLSGETIAKIFTGAITKWNDPQISSDNNGRTFPDTAIIPVVRSDGSGTTAQFTTWLDKQYPSLWRSVYAKGGLTSYYPQIPSAVGASSSDQVMNSISAPSGNGTIGYVEYSYPVNKGYPVVKVLNAGGFYVEPTQYNVAVALTTAKINTADPTAENYLTQDLSEVYTNGDPRAYPLSSYSYMLIPTASDDSRMKGQTNKRQTLVDFLFYSLCEGQGKAGAYGYSPLPLNLVQAGFEQIGKLGAADGDVDIAGREPTRCNNPTFVPGDLSKNHLAEVAPQPAACDKSGAGPCLGSDQSQTAGGAPVAAGAGAGGAVTTAGGAANGTKGGTASAASGGALPTAGGAADTAGQVDPETGLPVSSGDGTMSVASASVSTVLPPRPVGGSLLFGVLAAIELLALVLLPALLIVLWRRNRTRAITPTTEDPWLDGGAS